MVVAFGSLFNQIYIERVEAGGTKNILVPISYAPKEKWITRIQNSDNSHVQVTLPRMAFDITSMVYDPTRKRNSLQRKISRNTATAGLNTSFAEVPYNIDFGLYIYSRNIEDGLKILEQILPYFAPEFIVSINFDAENRKIDVPIYLTAVTTQEDYDGEMDTRRSVIYTLNFTMKSYVFGAVKSYEEIRKVISSILDLDYFDDYNPVGSGVTGSASIITIGITGPQGVSSDQYNYSSTVRLQEFAGGLAQGSTLATGITTGW